MNSEFTCAACQDALPGYVAGTLSPAIHAAVEGHLALCAECRRELAQWRVLADAAQYADAHAPGGAAMTATTWAAIQRQLLPESPITTGAAVIMDFDQQGQQTEAQLSSHQTSTRAVHQPRRSPLFATATVVALVALAAAIFALRPHASTPSVGTHVHATTVPTQVLPNTSLPNLLYSPANNQTADILAPDDIWAVGNSITGSAGMIVHFDGHQWQIADNTTYANSSYSAISMDSPSDGWVAGSVHVGSTDELRPFLLHFTQGHWVPTTLDEHNTWLGQVQMFSASDGWAEGENTDGQSVFFHFTGGNWTKVPFAPVAASDATLSFTAATFAPRSALVPASSISPNVANIMQAQMLSDSDGWAIGTYHNQSLVWHYHNGQWVATHQFTGSIFGLGVKATNDVWVIGVTGPLGSSEKSATLSSQGSLSFGPPVLQHFDGHTWTTVPINVDGNAPFLNGAAWLNNYGIKDQQQVIQGLFHNQGGTWVATTFPQPVYGVLNATSQPDGSTLAVVANGDNNSGQTLQLLRYANGVWSVVNR